MAKGDFNIPRGGVRVMTESDKSLTLRDAAELELMANARALCLELELMRQMAAAVVNFIELRKPLLKYRDAADHFGVPIRLSVLAALEESIVLLIEGDAALARLDDAHRAAQAASRDDVLFRRLARVMAALEESIVEGDAALARLNVMAESERVAMTEGDND